MTIGILKEPAFESRVSLLPEQAELLIKKGIKVITEENAGLKAFAGNAIYTQKGVEIASRQKVIAESDILLFLHFSPASELNEIKPGAIAIGVYQPLINYSQLSLWNNKNITCFSLDMLPRTTRAQSMDVLSSQANIAGYKAVLLAANVFTRYFPMFMTAAGSIAPAKVLILGAGVAGLQAIATAKRLGAVVEVFDTRPAVKEEVKSLGAKFIEVEGAADPSQAGGYAVEQSEEYKQKQQQKIAEAVTKADIIITTAQIPGKKAPVLVTTTMLNSMKPGSVIIDLAASTGGNTELSQADSTIEHNGVTIIGNSNLQSTMPMDASKLYGKNLLNFLQLILTKEGSINLNFDDDLVKGSCITHAGEFRNDRVKSLLNH